MIESRVEPVEAIYCDWFRFRKNNLMNLKMRRDKKKTINTAAIVSLQPNYNARGCLFPYTFTHTHIHSP